MRVESTYTEEMRVAHNEREAAFHARSREARLLHQRIFDAAQKEQLKAVPTVFIKIKVTQAEYDLLDEFGHIRRHTGRDTFTGWCNADLRIDVEYYP